MNFYTDSSNESLIARCTAGVLESVSEAWSSRKSAHLVITGGRTGLSIVKAIDQDLFKLVRLKSAFEGCMLHIWFSDERFTSVDDPDRNDTVLISGFGLCKSQLVFHRVDADGDLEEAARSYAAEIDSELGERPFDAVVLSMGEDGHIASLFPGLFEPDFTGAALAVHNSPKAPPLRVSISLTRLANASKIFIFALGEAKAAALQSIATGPVGALAKSSPNGQLDILTDLPVPTNA
jgi:6-phosphogluconolactonase